MRARALAVLTLVILAGCTNGTQQPTADPVEPCGALDPAFQVDPTFEPIFRINTSKGTVDIMVYFHQVPFTAKNMIGLARDGFFDETRFYRLDPDVGIAGGDPNTETTRKSFWGQGGPGYEIVDEFHQFLRHDQPGIVSMSNEGPNTAGSRFIIHMDPRPTLDDRHAVWGKVVDGMDVVRALAETPTDDRGRPQFNARINDVTIVSPESRPEEATVSLSSFGFDCEQVAEPGGTAEFLVDVRNTGQRILNGTYTDDAPDGWNLTLRHSQRVVIPSGQTSSFIADVDVPETAAEGTTQTINVTFQDPASAATTNLELTVEVGRLGPSPTGDDVATITYIGTLEDGRPVDTTIQRYTEIPWMTWFNGPGSHLEPVPIEVDTGRFPGEEAQGKVIDGVRALAERAKVGQTVVGVIPPDEGYGGEDWGESNLGGRLLYFQLQVVSLEPADGT